jgi:hypothetical protein
MLAAYNAKAADPALRMRLRAVVHAGDVHLDRRGYYGEAIDVAIRLLDAPPVKKALQQAAAPLVLVVSEEIYFAVVRHGYVDADTYRRLVHVRVSSRPHRGWVHVPLADPAAVAVSPAPGARLAGASGHAAISIAEKRADQVATVNGRSRGARQTG